MNKIKLINDDCLKALDVLIKNNTKVDAIITDIPYGITGNKWDTIIPLDKLWDKLNKLIKPKKVIALFGAEPFASILRLSNKNNYKYDWYWHKTNAKGFLNAKKMPLKAIENICIFQSTINYNPQMTYNHPPYSSNRKPSLSKNYTYGTVKNSSIITKKTTRYPTNVIKFSSDTQRIALHPTQKPVKLMEYLTKTYTNKGDTVLDFTMGSGTTGVACKKLNRDFIGIELDKNYFEIAQKRIKMTHPDLI